MKHTDLMHGDWFNSKKGTCRINEIKLFTAIVEMSDEAYANGAESSYEMDFEYDLEPIPVTEEILKANGFKRTTMLEDTKESYVLTLPDGWEVKYWPMVGGCDRIKHNNEVKFVATRCLTNVHQFQHALRLVGLDDLADKFTLTEKQPLKS